MKIYLNAVECVTNWLRYDQWRTTGGGGSRPILWGAMVFCSKGEGGGWAVAQYFEEQWSFVPRQCEM